MRRAGRQRPADRSVPAIDKRQVLVPVPDQSVVVVDNPVALVPKRRPRPAAFGLDHAESFLPAFDDAGAVLDVLAQPAHEFSELVNRIETKSQETQHL